MENMIFEELSNEQLQDVEGGGLLLGFAIGAAIGAVAAIGFFSTVNLNDCRC